MPLRAVSLDVGWTLAYPRESIWEILADVCAASGKDARPLEIERFVRSVWSVGQLRAEESLKNGGNYSDSDEEFIGQFWVLSETVFRQLGVTGPTEQLFAEFLRRFWHAEQWQLFPDTLEAIRELRALGLRVGVLSNAPTNMPLLLERLGVLAHLDYVVISAAEGVRKPDKRIFARALERAGTKPSETAHVGDMYVEDVLGGRNVGLHAFLIERGSNALFPHHRESEGRDLPGDRVVESLADFVARIRELL
ncbi:MAG: hypothetical protein KatS3mg077_0179 [Candidatus Binatia bacterium]|nr:MAG: hypothetical protein KatS3mg077_0179 [Candidatus Binatia bacterium]